MGFQKLDEDLGLLIYNGAIENLTRDIDLIQKTIDSLKVKSNRKPANPFARQKNTFKAVSPNQKAPAEISDEVKKRQIVTELEASGFTNL